MVAIDPPQDFDDPSLSQEDLFWQPEFQPDFNMKSHSSDAAGSPSVSLFQLDWLGVASSLNIPEIAEYAVDDTAATSQPSCQVDYLSPDWNKEEDIWLSWRYVISKRRELANRARLENASWRAWMKVRNNLNTTSTEQLNWLKDCDVTWLYGPLLRGRKITNVAEAKSSFATVSKTRCRVNLTNKPILKKRTVSETMLQQPIRSASLLKQPTAPFLVQESQNALQHETDKSLTDRYDFFRPYTKGRSYGSSSSMVSPPNEFVGSPYPERKYIHFDEQVEQWIAIDAKDDDNYYFKQDYMDEDTEFDDSRAMPSSKKRSKLTSCSDKIISKLPPAALKCGQGAAEPRETVMKHGASDQRSSKASPSSSEQTFRPTIPSPKVFFVEIDDDDSSVVVLIPRSDWRLPFTGQAEDDPQRLSSSASLTNVPVGMRRNPLGMFITCGERGSSATDGIISRIKDTINTVRDIAYVILTLGSVFKRPA